MRRDTVTAGGGEINPAQGGRAGRPPTQGFHLYTPLVRSRISFIVLLLLAAIAFFLWHAPLLSEAGRVRGFNSDAAIITLMGKKMSDGRGFDLFFWGQNYVGPLSSMFIAAAGFLTGGVNALAMRVGVFVEVFLGIAAFGWLTARVDRRAGALAIALLLLTPPVILRMMITPLGAEMAFLMSALLAAIVVQHLTAPEGRGWLGTWSGQFVFGVVAGIGWWMNQQVVFALLAAALVFALRSSIARAFWLQLRPFDRVRLRGAPLGWRPMPGILEALAAILSGTGLVLLVAFVVMQLGGLGTLPFVFGPVADPLILIAAVHLLLPLVLGEWRRWRAPHGPREGFEMRSLLVFALGAITGYAPVLLGAMFGWYERSYVFAFAPSYPRDMLAQGSILADEVLPHTLGLAGGLVGATWAVSFLVLLGTALMRARRMPVRLFFAAAAGANLLFFIMTRGGKPHYFIGTVAMLLALAALGASDLWDSRRTALRVLAVAGVAAAILSIGVSARTWHRDVLAEPDPLALLARVEAAGCAVTYADFWIAYRYRLLDDERRAWIPYRSQNRTLTESAAAQKLPGQRCLVTNEGDVRQLERDLPLQWDPRALSRRERPSV